MKCSFLNLVFGNHGDNRATHNVIINSPFCFKKHSCFLTNYYENILKNFYRCLTSILPFISCYSFLTIFCFITIVIILALRIATYLRNCNIRKKNVLFKILFLEAFAPVLSCKENKVLRKMTPGATFIIFYFLHNLQN